ncbi:hypothetical protein KDM41_06775 [bacterium]|nr:hypothetical protein [bacterium]
MSDDLKRDLLMIAVGNLGAGLVQYLAFRFTSVGRVGGFGLYIIVLACVFGLFGADMSDKGIAVTVLIGLAVLLFGQRAPHERTVSGQGKAGRGA